MSIGRRTPFGLVIVALAACGAPADPAAPDVVMATAIQARTEGGITFLTMRIDMAEHMSALFEGSVVADPAGCLRLGGPDAATVVWPKGATLERRPGMIVIRDASGALLGQVGGQFRLGGGEVPFLHEGLGFSQADRDLAEALCPGRYWIATPT